MSDLRGHAVRAFKFGHIPYAVRQPPGLLNLRVIDVVRSTTAVFVHFPPLRANRFSQKNVVMQTRVVVWTIDACDLNIE